MILTTIILFTATLMCFPITKKNIFITTTKKSKLFYPNLLKQKLTTPKNTLKHQEIVTFLHQLAALLESGTTNKEVWSQLRSIYSDTTLETMLKELEKNALNGRNITQTLRQNIHTNPYWTGLANCWDIATECGAPLATILKRYAQSIQLQIEANRSLNIALSGPNTTANILFYLPLIALCISTLLGIDVLKTLITTTLGNILLLSGTTLLISGRIWVKILVKKASCF